MRAVWAILKDSMREAVASRVLVVAVIAICFVLAVLCPLSLTIGASTGLRPDEVPDLQKLAEKLVEGSDKPTTPAGQVWSLLSSHEQKTFQMVASPEETEEESRLNGSIVAGRGILLPVLNELFGKPEFYKPEAFQVVELPDELKASDAGLSDVALRLRNLKRFAAAFPGIVTLQSEDAFR